MAKLKPVSNAELAELTLHSADDLLFTMMDIVTRIEKGYCDDLEGVVSHVRTLSNLIRTAAELSNQLLIKQTMQDL